MTDLENTKKIIRELDQFVKDLDPAVREAAFLILAEKTLGGSKPTTSTKHDATPLTGANGMSVAAGDIGSFISNFDHDKPKDNVFLLVAWLYSQHGVYPITAKDIGELASGAGLTVPSRPDNTMRTAKHNGKSLFNQHGKGWQLTVSGELRMQEIYGVKKGSKPKPD